MPAEYLEIIKRNGITGLPLQVFWEKHSRNKGKKELLKILRQKNNDSLKTLIFKIENTGYFIEDKDNYGRIILTRLKGHDKYGTPACPLIMAGFNILQSAGYEKSINFYYIGEDNIDNIPNHHAIEKGKITARLFGSRIQVENIYFNSFS